jgi:hypothetical protein
LEEQHPQLVVSDMKKALRTGKVLVDWSQNDEHKTTVSVYSLRARERQTVSSPLKWEEVERVLAKKDPKLVVFEAPQVLERVDKFGDLFEPVLKIKQKLPDIQDILAAGEIGEKERVDIAAAADERAAEIKRKVARRGPPPADAKEVSQARGRKSTTPRKAARTVAARAKMPAKSKSRS